MDDLTYENYHLQEPVAALKETVASSFPMVIEFLEILDENPQDLLSNVWETIIDEIEDLNEVQKNCIASIQCLNWPGYVGDWITWLAATADRP